MPKKIILILLLSCSVFYSQNKIKNIELYDNMVKNGNYIEAIAGYDKIILLKPKNAVYLYKRGLAKLQSGTNLDGAIKDFSKAIEIKPKYSDAFWGRGMARKMKHEYKEASEDLEQGISLDPNNDEAYISLAEVKYHLTDFTKADFYYSKYLKKHPNDYGTYSDRGYVRMERLYLKEAIEDYTKAIELNPNEQYKDYLERGKAKYLIQDYENANSDFNKAIEINPNSLDLLYFLGTFFVEQEKFNEAISYFDKILILDKNNSRALLYRGFSKNGLEKFDEALLDLNKAIELDPDLGYTYIQRGYSKVKLGIVKKACVDFNKAKELGEEDADEFIEDYCK
jgi:tetratricopeptide (TPR) repeat protein